MAYQITGKIEMIGEVMTKPSSNGGQPFQSREFVLDATRFNPETGEPWENHPRLELSGKNVNIIDGFCVGQRVTVDFALRGSKYQDRQTGEWRYFTTISAFKIIAVEQSIQQSAQQIRYNEQPTPQPQYQQTGQPYPQQAANQSGQIPYRAEALPF